jgi:hypothetical protein
MPSYTKTKPIFMLVLLEDAAGGRRISRQGSIISLYFSPFAKGD